MEESASKDWLEGHTTESPLELLEKKSTHDPASVLLAFGQAVERKFQRDGRSVLSDIEFHVFTICALDRDIKYGGFMQFFESSSCYLAEHIVDALKAAGAKEHARVAESAIAALKLPCPPNPEVVDFVLQIEDNLIGERLSDCDVEYNELEHDVTEFALDYLGANLSEVEFTIMGKGSMDRGRRRQNKTQHHKSDRAGGSEA